MTKLGWSKEKAKWGGKDYSRAIWVRDGYWIDRGKLRGPGGYSQNLGRHIDNPTTHKTAREVETDEKIEEFKGPVY